MRQGIQAPHSFAYKRRHGLTDAENLAVPVQGDDEDVFCIVKHRMHSIHPNGVPTLVLPHDRSLAVQTPAPVQWEDPTPFGQGRRGNLLQLAHVLESSTEDWGTNLFLFPSSGCFAGIGPWPQMPSHCSGVAGPAGCALRSG